MRRLALLVTLASLLSLGPAASASGCSCAPVSPRESLRESDAAVVVDLIEVVPRGRFQADYRYEVVRVYRGARILAVGQPLSVRSARRAAVCALPRRLGRRYGLFLTRSAGRWRAGICSVISPRRLWEAVRRAGRSRTGDADSGTAKGRLCDG